MGFKFAEVLKFTPELLKREDRCPVDKKSYYTREEAQTAVKKINHYSRAPMRSFRCDYCQRYHLGHARGTDR